MKVTIKDFNVDWMDIKNACRETINMGDSKVAPTEEWKKKLLIARHSPLRIGNILYDIEDIPYYVMGHLVRHHVGVTPFVGTSREDRTGVKREERRQTDLVSMQLLVDVEALLNISAKRLCQCADKETIKVWKAVLEATKELDPTLYWACVPSGIERGGCPETFGDCQLCNKIIENMPREEAVSLIKRYDAYNKWRDKHGN